MGIIEGVLTIAGVCFVVLVFSFVLLKLAGYEVIITKRA